MCYVISDLTLRIDKKSQGIKCLTKHDYMKNALNIRITMFGNYVEELCRSLPVCFKQSVVTIEQQMIREIK